jgi:hypothetical protein
MGGQTNLKPASGVAQLFTAYLTAPGRKPLLSAGFSFSAASRGFANGADVG